MTTLQFFRSYDKALEFWGLYLSFSLGPGFERLSRQLMGIPITTYFILLTQTVYDFKVFGDLTHRNRIYGESPDSNSAISNSELLIKCCVSLNQHGFVLSGKYSGIFPMYLSISV